MEQQIYTKCCVDTYLYSDKTISNMAKGKLSHMNWELGAHGGEGGNFVLIKDILHARASMDSMLWLQTSESREMCRKYEYINK